MDVDPAAQHHARVRRLYLAARELQPIEQRAFLDQACAGVPGLRQEVEGYLADESSGSGSAPVGLGAGLQGAGEAAAERPEESALASLELRTGWRMQVRLRPPSHDDEVGDAVPVPARGMGRYELLGQLAQGGVGVVLRGRDRDLGRDVAVKVLREDLANNPGVVQRFVEEAQIGGQLQHPGIVPVYDFGLQHDGLPFFAMKLVRGDTLAELLRQRGAVGMDRRRSLAVFEQVCQTIAYAHARGVVHRDLKPANIMVGAFGEVQVVDWGLAKVVDQPQPEIAVETVRTHDRDTDSVTGAVMGTPSYMAPEQARAGGAEVDARADVFSLGAILCEILTGAPPYGRNLGREGVAIAAAADLGDARERLAACGADDALVELVLACLAPRTEDRPPNAGWVADAVGRYAAALEERARAAQLRAAAAKMEISKEREARKREVAAAASHATRVRALGDRRQRRLRIAVISSWLILVGALAAAAFAWNARETQLARALSTATEQAFFVVRQSAPPSSAPATAWAAVAEHAGTVHNMARLHGADAMQLAEISGFADRAKARAVERGAAQAAAARVDQLMREVDAVFVPGAAVLDERLWQPSQALRLDRSLRRVFRRAGVDVDQQPVAELAERLRGVADAGLAVRLAAWARLRRRADQEVEVGASGLAARPLDLLAALQLEDPEQSALTRLLATSEGDPAALASWLERHGVERLSPAAAWLASLWLEERGDLGRADQVASVGLRQRPDDFALLVRAGTARERAGQPLAALVAWARAAAARPDLADLGVRVGVCLQAAGDVVAARAQYSAVLEVDRGHRVATWLLERLPGEPKER